YADERRVDDLSYCAAPCHSTRTHGVLESKVADAAGSATDAVADVCGLRGVDHPDDLQLDARRQHLDQSAATTERCAVYPPCTRAVRSGQGRRPGVRGRGRLNRGVLRVLPPYWRADLSPAPRSSAAVSPAGPGCPRRGG